MPSFRTSQAVCCLYQNLSPTFILTPGALPWSGVLSKFSAAEIELSVIFGADTDAHELSWRKTKLGTSGHSPALHSTPHADERSSRPLFSPQTSSSASLSLGVSADGLLLFSENRDQVGKLRGLPPPPRTPAANSRETQAPPCQACGGARPSSGLPPEKSFPDCPCFKPRITPARPSFLLEQRVLRAKI